MTTLAYGDQRDRISEQTVLNFEAARDEPGVGTRGGPVPSLTLDQAITRLWQAHPADVRHARAVALLTAAHSGEVHADDFAPYQFDQRNAIGVAFNTLTREGLLVSTGEHRKGTSKASHGRRSYVYRLTPKGRREAERLTAEAQALKEAA